MTEHVQGLLDYLGNEGFPVHLDADGDIAFKCEGLAYFLCFDDADPAFGKLVLPNVWALEDAGELQRALVALDTVNRKMKVVKGHTQRDQVCFTVELWLDQPMRWTEFLQRAIRALGHGVSLFAKHMRPDDTVKPVSLDN